MTCVIHLSCRSFQCWIGKRSTDYLQQVSDLGTNYSETTTGSKEFSVQFLPNFRFHYYCIRFGIIFSQTYAVMTAKSTCKNWFTIIPKDVQEAEDFGSTRISEAPSAVAVQDKLKDQVKLWSTKWWMFALQVSTNNFTVNFPSRFRYRALTFPCHLFPNLSSCHVIGF